MYKKFLQVNNIALPNLYNHILKEFTIVHLYSFIAIKTYKHHSHVKNCNWTFDGCFRGTLSFWEDHVQNNHQEKPPLTVFIDLRLKEKQHAPSGRLVFYIKYLLFWVKIDKIEWSGKPITEYSEVYPLVAGATTVPKWPPSHMSNS